jgi:hypothetical protein
MGTINLSNSKGRDAMVNTESVATPLYFRWIDDQGREVKPVRILRGTVEHDLDALLAAAGDLAHVADLLVAGDPEVDVESYGTFLDATQRVWVGPDKKVVHTVQQFEVIRNPDGTVKDRRPRQVTLANTNTEVPLRWSGKLYKKAEVYNKFVFAAKQQIAHVNGLTYDFLYAIAKELEDKQALLLLGGGPKASQPLVFQRGGTQYRGFLEGRTQGDKYCLILHLANLELKAPPPRAEALAAAPAPAPDAAATAAAGGTPEGDATPPKKPPAPLRRGKK